MVWSNVAIAVYLLLGYSYLCIGMPLICLYPVLKGVGINKGFLICIISSNLYIFAAGYLLGYMGIFNEYTVFGCVIILPLLFRLFFYWEADKVYRVKLRGIIGALTRNEYGKKLFFLRVRKWVKRHLVTVYQTIFAHKILEWVVVLICIGFSVYIYGYRKFRSYGYSAADEEVHLYWVQSLIRNEFFPSGMYPHGMHTLFAVISVLFKISAIRVTLGFSHIILIMVLIVAYLVLRQLFSNKYGVMAVFILYTIGNFYVNYDRFHFTLPMEYGMFSLFILTGALISYIHNKNKLDWFLIAGSIIYTLSCHFYVTIAAGIICVVIGIIYFVTLIKRRLLIRVLGAGIIGIVIGILPFIAGFILGYPFEQSMAWAVSIISTSEENDTGDIETEEEEVLEVQEEEVPKTLIEKLHFALLERVYKNNTFLLVITIAAAFSFLYGMFGVIFSREKDRYLLYICLSILWLIGNIMAISYDLNWPVLIEVKRQVVFLTYFTMILLCVPLEAIFRLLEKGKWKSIWNHSIFFILSIGVGYGLIYTKHVKGEDLFYWDIQTEGAMKLVLSLIDEKEDFSWTIVSPVNDRSAILNNGYHYELLDLVEELEEWEEDKAIYILSEEVYFVIEKYPLNYILVPLTKPYPVTGRKPVNYEAALESIEIDEKERSKTYQKQRQVIMSKAYYWAKEYQRYYPHEMKVYYEDEEVIVYRLIQAPYHLNNLSINYGANSRDITIEKQVRIR